MSCSRDLNHPSPFCVSTYEGTQYEQGPQEGIGSSRTRVTEYCEPHGMGAGNKLGSL